ncbi:MAG: SDR family oxidoreductase [Sphingorhabdus sp.]
MSEAKPLALVTGGMRRLGAAIAARLAKAGYDLAISSHVDGAPDTVLGDAIDQNGTNWHSFIADLADPVAPAKLVADVTSHFGRAPDLLVNNAAIFGQDDWTAMDAATLDAHFRLNTFAPVLLSQELVKVAPGQIAIVHILDQRIANPHLDQISYTLSKQALAASVNTMATAFGAKARVNAIAPGLVIVTEDYTTGQAERLATMMPLGALPDPDGIADAVLYLASARHVTGQTIFVDGGAHLKSFERDFIHL